MCERAMTQQKSNHGQLFANSRLLIKSGSSEHIVPRSIFGRSRTGRGLMKLTYHAWQHFSMMADHGANACFVFCIPALSNLLSCPVVILHSAPLELLVGFF